MTDNDYLAEYVKEQYPGIAHSYNFAIWKLGNMSRNFMEELASMFTKALNNEDVTKIDLPVLEDQSYHEYIKEQGKRYCKKHCGTMDNLCSGCPLAHNLFCINQEGELIINEDTVDYISAVEQHNYMIEEVNKVD